MGALLTDPRLWLAAIGLITVLVGLYKSFLSEKARKRREQKKITQDHSEAERDDIRSASSEVTQINDSIKDQGDAANDWFNATTRKSKPPTQRDD